MSAKKKISGKMNLTSATGSLSIDDKPWTENISKLHPEKIKVETRTLDQILEKDKINQNRC